MPSKLKSFLSDFFCQNYAYRRLGLALGLSLLIHFLLFQDLQLPLQSLEQPINTVMVQLQPVASVLPAPRISSKAVPKAKPQRTPVPPVPAPELEHPPVAQAAAEPLAPQTEQQLPDGEQPETLPTDAEPSAVAEAEAAPASIEDPAEGAEQAEFPALKANYLYVATEFDISRSAGGGKVGQTRVIYQAMPDGSYTINSVSEAEGLLSLFLSGQLMQRSEGSITEAGLQPAEFLYQYGDAAKKKQHALLDWQAGQLTLETRKGVKHVPLLAGTQDLLSFMYQFMFVPPLEQMQLSITNGKSLTGYTYSFEGEERLATKMGEMSTVHIASKGDEGEEKTELWLAVDYDYVPVKMRKTEEDGSVVEQVATHISTEP